MKTIKLFFAAFMLFFALETYATAWTQKASMVTGRTTAAGFSVNGKGYVCGGILSNTDLKDLWEFDPVSNVWSQKADMPGLGRRELSAFAIDSLGYVGHGRSVATGEIYYSFYQYSPATNSWVSIASCPVQRYTSTGFSIAGMGYVTCGILPGVARYKDLYQYNPVNNSWTKKASLPDTALNRSYACVVTHNNKAYLSGGFEGLHMNDVYEYDPLADTWIEKQAFPGTKRGSMVGFSMGQFIAMGLGKDLNGTACRDMYIYDPIKNTWTLANAIFPVESTFGLAAFTISNKGYVCGGSNNASAISKQVYEFSAPELLGISQFNYTGKKPLKLFKPAGSESMMVKTENDGLLHLKLYDLNGKLIMRISFEMQAEIPIQISTGGLVPGMYVAELKQHTVMQHERILIN